LPDPENPTIVTNILHHQILKFWGRKGDKFAKFITETKRHFLVRNASFDVWIVKIGQQWRPVGEVKKREKEKGEKFIFGKKNCVCVCV